MGINYLALSDLFQMSNERKDIVNYSIQVQMVEIYNEQVRDLLAEDSTATKYPFSYYYYYYYLKIIKTVKNKHS
jgi:kinesin family protein C2/C3